ncbi:MAG: histidine phosphatase family protein [Natronohydrobacter sp.]|nr:histidine phosphatase family protein [Natronohydrobacter sp.]
MRLILVRHGETLWNIEQRLQGHADAPLSPRGVQQAVSFIHFARALAPKGVVSSDLGRCRETARIMGFEDAPADARLRELNMGDWTGRTKPELIATQPEEYWAWRAGRYYPENGETLESFRERVAEGLRDWLRRTDGDLLAIVHSGVVRAALSAFLGLDQEKLVPVTPGTGTILNFADASSDDVRLEGFNLGLFAPQEEATLSD